MPGDRPVATGDGADEADLAKVSVGFLRQGQDL